MNEKTPEFIEPSDTDIFFWLKTARDYIRDLKEVLRTERAAVDELRKENAELKYALESLKIQRDYEPKQFTKKVVEKFKELSEFSPHCCEDCPCDYFRQVSSAILTDPMAKEIMKEKV